LISLHQKRVLNRKRSFILAVASQFCATHRPLEHTYPRLALRQLSSGDGYQFNVYVYDLICERATWHLTEGSAQTHRPNRIHPMSSDGWPTLFINKINF
jgi:hypothetical protein